MNMFFDMHVDNVDTNNIYIATNSTDLMHVTYIDSRIKSLTYKPAVMSEFHYCDIALKERYDNVKLIKLFIYYSRVR